MTLTDLTDWYLDGQGNLNRWRGGTVTPGQPTAPGTPRNPQATVSGTTVTVTWALPASDGGSPLTAMKVTQQGGVTHTLAATAVSDTFTVSGSGPWIFNIVASNIVGDSRAAAATASTAATAYRFPGDTLPLLTGKLLVGATEYDENGMVLQSNVEWVAPEADTGVRYSIQKHFCQGANVLSAFTPSTGEMATVAKRERARGHIVLFNVAIQQSTDARASTWRAAANLTANSNFMHGIYYNFIQWCEEGADAPDCPIWLCMPHEAQGPGSFAGHKYSLVVADGMLPGDYADMNWAFRQCMDEYALSKVGGSDPTLYKWKRLSFGALHTGDAFPSGAAFGKNINDYYISHATGNPIPMRVHDWIGGDPYQNPIGGRTTPGRTGVPGWSSNMQAMADWCKSRNKPIVFGEYGVHNSDADAGPQLQSWWNKVIGGVYDIVAVCYFHSAPNAPPLDVNTGTGRWLFTDYIDNLPASGSNGGMYTTWKNIMRSNHVVHFWDLGYSRPSGV